MCIPKKNVSCRSKSILRYLNSVYNIKLTQGVGISHDTTSKTYGVYADSHLNLVCTKDASLVICNGRNAGWHHD